MTNLPIYGLAACDGPGNNWWHMDCIGINPSDVQNKFLCGD